MNSVHKKQAKAKWETKIKRLKFQPSSAKLGYKEKCDSNQGL